MLNEVLTEEIINEIKKEFLDTFQDRIDELNKNLFKIEKDNNNKDAIEEIYRTLHNIKSTAGTLGFEEISVKAHRMEDMISVNIDTPERFINRIDNFYKEVDELTELVNIYKEGKEVKKEKKPVIPLKNYAMVIEVSKTIRNTIINRLKDNFSILISDNPIDALKRIILEPVTLLITSKELEYIDGITLIKMIKDIPNKSDIKTILLTSSDINTSVPDFVVKKDSKFIERIDKIIESLR